MIKSTSSLNITVLLVCDGEFVNNLELLEEKVIDKLDDNDLLKVKQHKEISSLVI